MEAPRYGVVSRVRRSLRRCSRAAAGLDAAVVAVETSRVGALGREAGEFHVFLLGLRGISAAVRVLRCFSPSPAPALGPATAPEDPRPATVAARTDRLLLTSGFVGRVPGASVSSTEGRTAPPALRPANVHRTSSSFSTKPNSTARRLRRDSGSGERG